MDEQKKRVIAVDDISAGISMMSAREVALAEAYPGELREAAGVTINICADPFMAYEEKRLARERERRRLMLADFDRAHPTTEGDRQRQAKAEAKRARRQARNLATR